MSNDLARAKAEAVEARQVADTYPDDRMYRYQADAAESKLSKMRLLDNFASDARDDRLAMIEHRLDALEQRLADVDSRTRTAVDKAVKSLCDDLERGFATPLGEILKREFDALDAKLARLENLRRSLVNPPDPPAPMHDRRAAN